MIVAELGDGGAVLGGQDGFVALVVHLGDGHERRRAGEGADLFLEFLRHLELSVDGFPQRRLDLYAGADARQLQVPPVVLATAAAAQGDPGSGQAQILGVVVDRREVVVRGRGDGGDPLDAGQVGCGGLFRDGELGLDLKKCAGGHDGGYQLSCRNCGT